MYEYLSRILACLASLADALWGIPPEAQLKEIARVAVQEIARIAVLERSCNGCPDQWEGFTDQGWPVYIRYRGGRFSVVIGYRYMPGAIRIERYFREDEQIWMSDDDLRFFLKQMGIGVQVEDVREGSLYDLDVFRAFVGTWRSDPKAFSFLDN